MATTESLAFTLFPRKVTEGQNKVVLMLDKPLNSRSTLVVRLEKQGGQRLPVEDVKLRNPYTLVATLPACLFAKSSLGKVSPDARSSPRVNTRMTVTDVVNTIHSIFLLQLACTSTLTASPKASDSSSASPRPTSWTRYWPGSVTPSSSFARP